jgi:hypothetical protein
MLLFISSLGSVDTKTKAKQATTPRLLECGEMEIGDTHASNKVTLTTLDIDRYIYQPYLTTSLIPFRRLDCYECMELQDTPARAGSSTIMMRGVLRLQVC